MKISEKFKELEQKGEKALIIYITAGYPSVEESKKIASKIVDSGADIIEFGLPFSDPIADGPTIQESSQKALETGMDTDKYFKMIKELQCPIPVVCMTYYNLLLQHGLERFCKSCAETGVDGLIIADLPIEEADELDEICKREGIDLIFIVSPNTGKQRLEKALRKSRGFIYLQSVLGITGARKGMNDVVFEKINQIKQESKLPVCVGFGISTPEHAEKLAKRGADGVIVGSAVIDLIKKNKSPASFVKSLKEAL